MNNLIKKSLIFTIICLSLVACAGQPYPAMLVTPQPNQNQLDLSVVTTTPARVILPSPTPNLTEELSNPIPTPIVPPVLTATKPSEPTVKVNVVYFHNVLRCPTCLCFEERINFVVNTYFSTELENGQLTYAVLSLGDDKNKSLITKYGAVSSQLFVNTIIDGKDNIRDIQNIWDWNCRTNSKIFDAALKSVIEQSLKGKVFDAR